MRLVREAVLKPHSCAVLPHLGGHHAEGYIDPGHDLNGIDPRPYVSVVAVQEMGRLIGLVPQEDHAAALDEVAELRVLTDQLLAENAEKARLLESIDAIESAGFRARKKAGRPPVKNVKQTEKVA